MLRETVIYNPLQPCPSAALITAVPHGQSQGTLSHHSRTSMEIRVHGKSLPRVFLAAIYVAEEFGNAEFDLDFSSLCKCLLGSGSWQRKHGGQWAPGKGEPGGLQRGSWVTSGEKDAPLHTSGACDCFFLPSLPEITFVCAFQTEGKQKSAWLLKTSREKKWKLMLRN